MYALHSLTASKHVRNVVNFQMAEGPRNLHTTDQKVWGSNPYGRALYKLRLNNPLASVSLYRLLEVSFESYQDLI